MQRIATNGLVAAIAADALLVATRLGQLGPSTKWLGAMPQSVLWQVPNPLNLVLAHARIGAFSRARTLIAAIRAAPEFRRHAFPESALGALEERITHAERLMRYGQELEGDEDRVQRATAFAELGIYLRALRVLRPTVERAPRSQEIVAFYVQLLLCARLEDEALHAASAALGPEQATAVLGQMRRQLNPSLLVLRKPQEPSPWWNPSGGR
jgi:hypothetical protein